MRIPRPSTRMLLTVLKDWERTLTCIAARVRLCVWRTLPSSSGNPSTWFLNTPVIFPCPSEPVSYLKSIPQDINR